MVIAPAGFKFTHCLLLPSLGSLTGKILGLNGFVLYDNITKLLQYEIITKKQKSGAGGITLYFRA